MSNKKSIILSIFVLFIGALLAGGTYAFWMWQSDINKSVLFNVASNLREYIEYDDGESTFVGSFQVSNTFLDGIHSTISIKKKASAENIQMIATINMDVNAIGANMARSSALKWVVTSGNSSSVGPVLSQGNFIGAKAGDTLMLEPGIEVTTTLKEYTVWIWLDASEHPSEALSGETLDTVVWTQIEQLEGMEEIFEITKISSVYQNIDATVVNNKYLITDYAVTATNTTPASWTSIPAVERNNIYNLKYDVCASGRTCATGTYYVWFKDSTGASVVKSVVVGDIDTTGPECTFDSFNPVQIANGETSTIVLTCTDNESIIDNNTINTNNLTTSSGKVNITNVRKESITNGYKYTITVTGTESDGTDTITLPANTIRNSMGLGNAIVTSGSITVANQYTVSYTSGTAACTLDQTTYADKVATYGISYTVVNPSCAGYTFSGWTSSSGLDTTNARYGTSNANTAWTNSSSAVKGSTSTYFNNLALRSTKHVTLVANWSLGDASYTVNHYIRNLGSNTYTLNSTDNLSGTTLSTVTLASLTKTISGFTYDGGYTTGNTTRPTSATIATTTILADGSRVINLYYRRNYLYIQYNMNGGSLASTHGANYGTSGSLVTYTGNTISTNFFRGVYGGKVGEVNLTTLAATDGLHNYNTASYINIEKSGYAAKSNAQWNTNAGGTGTSYDQLVETYDATSMATACGADLSAGDAVITLYVNWLENVYEVQNSSGSFVGYTDTLASALNNVPDNGKIIALKNNTSGSVTNTKNVTIDTNGKTITLTGAITNNSGKSLTINGNGTITSSSNLILIHNYGTMNTSSVTISSPNTTSYTIRNSGTYTVSDGTQIINNAGSGIAFFQGIINYEGGSINANGYGIRHSGEWDSIGNTTLNISGGVISTSGGSIARAIIAEGNDTNTFTMNMTGGTVTSSANTHAILIGTPANVSITDGTVISTNAAIYLSHASARLYIGTDNGSVTSVPRLVSINGEYTVHVDVGLWYWYDGELYGNKSNGNYYTTPNGTPDGYGSVTVADATYALGGFKSYLIANTNKVYEVQNASGTILSYVNTLASALNSVSDNGKIIALKDNTSGSVTNNKNVTIDVNGKTITLTGALTNGNDKTMLVTSSKSGGSITSSAETHVIINRGTLTTSSITLLNTSSASHTNYLVVNIGSYDADAGTHITSSSGRGVYSVKGIVNLKANTIVNGYDFAVIVPGNNHDVTTINITGATITSQTNHAILLSASSYSATLNMSSGTVIANATYGDVEAICILNPIAKTINITGGFIRSYANVGVWINTTEVSELTIGSKDGGATSSPVIVGASYGVGVNSSSSAIWNWYDGYLYGSNSERAYVTDPSDTETGYSPVTIVDTTYVSNGYRSYLIPNTNKVYEVQNSSGTVLSYTTTLASALSSVTDNGKIIALKNNTSGSVTNNKNVTIDTNGKTITLTGTIYNDSGKTLYITSSTTGGSMMTTSIDRIIRNGGTLITDNVTFYSSAASYVIYNMGTYTASVGTQITSEVGGGIAFFSGIINFQGGSISADTYGIAHGDTWTSLGDIELNISGGVINSGNGRGVYISSDGSNTFTMSMTAGTISASSVGIYLNSPGTASITGGTITSRGNYAALYVNDSSTTVTLGIKNNTVNSYPCLISIGGNYAVQVNSGTWNWYDGYLYGKRAAGNYSANPNDKPTSHSPVTIVDTTYATGGYKSYLISDSNKVYELQNSGGSVIGYTVSLVDAFNGVPNNGTIKALVDNISNVQISNTKNITLDTNGKTITLTGAITNNSGKTLTVNGAGKLTTNSININVFVNSGTLTTSSVTLANTVSTSHFYAVIANYGTYNANAGTNITSSSGRGITNYSNTVNLKSGVSVSAFIVPYFVPENATGNTVLNLTGATITSVSSAAVYLSGSSYTTTVSISSGSITGGDSTHTFAAIRCENSGTKNITITGGILKGYYTYGLNLNNNAGTTLILGSKDGTAANAPVIIGATYAIGELNNVTWKWYDGYLYGTTSGGNYTASPSDKETGFSPVTVVDTTYATGGYRSYLIADANKVYETINTNGQVTGYYNTLSSAFSGVVTGGSIRTLASNVSNVQISNTKNVTLDTNGKTITLNAYIDNGSGKTLNIISSTNGGKITSSSGIYMLSNHGTLTTSSVTLSNIASQEHSYFVVVNKGTYTANAGTNITSSSGGGILNNSGTVNLKANVNVNAFVFPLSVSGDNVSGNTTINITGATITSVSTAAIYLGASSYTTTVSISSGNITGGNSTHAFAAIATLNGGTKNITITGGTLRGYYMYGINLNNLSSATLILGSKDGGVANTPVIIGANYGVGNLTNATWKWYDGYLYGVTAAGNYTASPSDKETGFSPVTVVDTTYVSGGFRSYLLADSEKIYEVINTSNKVTGYYSTLSSAFSAVVTGGTIKTLANNISSVNITNSKNVTLNTNGKTITLNNPIINNSGYTLALNGSGSVISTSATYLINNGGTLVTTNVTLSATSTIMYNKGTYTASVGTQLTGGLGGIAFFSGTINFQAGNLTVSSGYAIRHVGTWTPVGDTVFNMSGGTITATSQRAIQVDSDTTYSFTMNMTGGTISSTSIAVCIGTSANMTITNGLIKSTGNYPAVYLNNANGVLTLGTNNTTVTAYPYLVNTNGNYAVQVVSGSWYWYDGSLYGVRAAGNYTPTATSVLANYGPVTVADTTYVSGGFKSYLYKNADKIYEVKNSSSQVIGYYGTLANAFTNVPASGSITALANNTSNEIATNTKNNVTLNTNGKKITLNNKELKNNSGNKLTINGGGTIVVSGDAEVKNHGTLETSSVSLSGSSSNYVIHNYGTYTSNNGTTIINSINGIALYSGTININGGLIKITSSGNAIRYTSAFATNSSYFGSASINMTGGSIDVFDEGCGIKADSDSTTYTLTVKMSGGIIDGGEYGILASSPGTYTITGGSILGANTGILMNKSNATLTLGASASPVGMDPYILGGEYAVNKTTGTWNWYDGALYGPTSANYSGTINAKPNGYEVVTIYNSSSGKFVSYLILSTAKIYEVTDKYSQITGYYDTLSSAFSGVDNNGAIKTLASNTSSVAITNSKNVTLNTNGKTIILAAGITNSAGKTLTINGPGTITSATAINMIVNEGTLNTSSVTLSNTFSASHSGYVVYNKGNYTVNNATNITSSSGFGIIHYSGALSVNGANTVISAYNLTVYVPPAASANTSITLASAKITATTGNAVRLNATAYTTTLTMNSGSITGNNGAYGIYITNAGGVTNANIYGGTITVYSQYAVRINSSGTATVTLGSSGGTFSETSPRLIDIGGSYAITSGGDGTTNWYWYSGDLYGTNATKGYNANPAGRRNGYSGVTIVNTDYQSGGYRTYLISDTEKIYEAKNSSNQITGYYSTLSSAFSGVVTGGTITALSNNISSVNITNSKNVTLNTNGKTITLNNPIINNSGYTLALNGSGSVISTSATYLINNGGTLVTTNVTLSATSTIMYNKGTYTASVGTQLTGGLGGIAFFSGTINFQAGNLTVSNGYAIRHAGTWTPVGNTVFNMSGGIITATSQRAIQIESDTTYSFTMNMTGGTISSTSIAVCIGTSANMTITNGLIKSTGNYPAVYLNNANGVLTLGTNNTTVTAYPYLVNTNGNYAVQVVSGSWYWYDGSLYGMRAAGNYTPTATSVLANYGPVTIVDTTYVSGGFKSYLYKNADKMYEVINGSGNTTGFYSNLSDAFANAANSATIKALANNVSSVAITNSKNVTLNTNGKTITVNALITNNSGKTLTINGAGTLTTATVIHMFSNYGTITTSSVTLANTYSASHNGYLIVNRGTYNADAGTSITSSFGRGVVSYVGTVNFKQNSSVSAYTYPYNVATAAEGNTVTNVTGANLSTASTSAIYLSASAYTTTVSISSGTLTGGSGSISKNGIDIINAGVKNITVSGGTITGTHSGIYFNASAVASITVSGGSIVGTANNGIAVNNGSSVTGTVSGGSIIGGSYGISTWNSASANFTLTGGFIKANANEAVRYGSGVTGTVTIGINNTTVNTTPTLVGSGGQGAIYLQGGSWYWYDGELYGLKAAGNYSPSATSVLTNYGPVTIVDTTYASGGFKSYLFKNADKIYEVINGSGNTTGYYSTLSNAFANAANSATIKALANNTSSAAITNTKNVTLNTNGKTITVNAAITNNSGKTLTVNGAGTMTTAASNINIFVNYGTMTTSSVTLANTYSASHNYALIANHGTYNANAGTNITSSSGRGITGYTGTVNLKSGATVNVYQAPLLVPGGATGNNVVNITGAIITSSVYHAVYISASSFTTTVSMSSGSVITNATSGNIYGIVADHAGTKTINITGGFIRSFANYGLYATTTGVTTVNLGTNDTSVNLTSPRIVGKTHAIRTAGSAKWNWYDGDLFGTNSTKEYYNDYNAAATAGSGYTDVTVSNTTYGSGGYRSYLRELQCVYYCPNGGTLNGVICEGMSYVATSVQTIVCGPPSEGSSNSCNCVESGSNPVCASGYTGGSIYGNRPSSVGCNETATYTLSRECVANGTYPAQLGCY